jgi:flavin-dependent dehydrogenase
MTEQETIYDCAIIGGGLAGLSLAIQLAKANKKVVLFEREEYPFHKVCGEYIALESWDFIEKLGVPLSSLNLPKLTKLSVSSPSGKKINHKMFPGGFGISRYTLDKMLYDIALAKGVEMLTGTKVDDVVFEADEFKLISNSKEYRAKQACGAFGKRSNLDVKWKRKFSQSKSEYVAVKYHIQADLAEDVIELHNFEDGYCGISKVDKERYCLCYLTSAQNLKKNKNSIEALEQNILQQNPHLKAYFSKLNSFYEKPLAISQISFDKKESIENHVLFVGDAAGLITPICGNGMSMALRSSKICFELLLQFFDKKISREEMELQYKMLWNKNFKNRLLVGRIIQRFFGKKILTEIFIQFLIPFPSLLKKLIRLTHGDSF